MTEIEQVWEQALAVKLVMDEAIRTDTLTLCLICKELNCGEHN